VQGVDIANVDSVQARRAGRDLLSLALMDSRNRTLRWAAAFEPAAGSEWRAQGGPASPLSAFGHIGWFQEHWIARNVQRQRGERCDATHPKLASILPEADACFGTAALVRAPGAADLPDLQTIRNYLVDTLETTLELLAGAADDDDALYFYRLALLREDACAERFAALAQTLGVDAGLLPPLATRPPRPPLLFPATRWQLGSEPGGLVPDREKWMHEVALPEFEIDAQAVSWAQYTEFVEDGGYDDRRHWSAPGWAWVQAQGRRTPRFVDQMRQGVLLRRFGQMVRI
jgi:gamma-glutamyl hercynylcysteine S-oxide synthase